MLTLSSTHYPTFSELKTFVPKTVERLIKTGSNSTDSLSCNVGLNNKGAKPTYDNSNKYCLFCKEDNHFSSDCLKFSTYHDRINRLREFKRCSYCGKKDHNKKDECGPLKCAICKKDKHKAILCVENMKKLNCNKGLTNEEIVDLSKIKPFSIVEELLT